MIQQRVIRYIEKEHLFSPDDKLLVALSGGADSVAFAACTPHSRLSMKLPTAISIYVVKNQTVTNGLSGNFAKKYGIRLHITDFNTTQYATEKRISIEMAARELRYNWFEKIKRRVRSPCNRRSSPPGRQCRNDAVQPHSGYRHYRFIRNPPRNGAIVRPLLCIIREEIIRYLQQIGQDFVTDSTNLEDEYTRNKIRLNLLPLMQEINPSVKNSLIETSNHLNDVATIYNKVIDEAKTRIITRKVSESMLYWTNRPRKVFLFETLHPLGFNSAQIKDIANSLHGHRGNNSSAKNGESLKTGICCYWKPSGRKTNLPFPIN